MSRDEKHEQSTRTAICAGKSVQELKSLLNDGKITINDARRALGMTEIEDRPMPLAEADNCCGQFRVANNEQVATLFCENCPLIIERLRPRDEQARLREARAH